MRQMTRAQKYMIKAEDSVVLPVRRGAGREVFRENIARAVRVLKEGGCLVNLDAQDAFAQYLKKEGMHVQVG